MNYCIIDVETTGGSPKSSKITEIAIYKHNGTEVVDEFVSLVNPEIKIPEFITRLTGISDKMVANAPKFYEIAKQIIEFTQDCIFVAHNVAFDYGVIRNEFKTLGYDYRREHLCTVRASRYVIPGHDSYSLGKLSADLGININGRHRAGGDAFATTELFTLLMAKDPHHLSNFIHQELNPKQLHPNLDREVIDEMPNRTGVYKFFNEENQLIYIGKSKNIKTRIEQHLRNVKTKKGIQMREEIARIEYELTGSELIAELLESQLIKQYQPRYNRMLRKNKYAYGLYAIPQEEGKYIEFKVVSTKDTEEHPITSFVTKREGTNVLTRWCERYSLCQKLCHLYPTTTSCFHYEIKQCFGACIGKEPVISYNARANQLISDLTFDGNSFFLLDKGRTKLEKSLIWIENGVLIGFGYIAFNQMKKGPNYWKNFITRFKEDRDAKTIINLYLRKNKLERVEY